MQPCIQKKGTQKSKQALCKAEQKLNTIQYTSKHPLHTQKEWIGK